MKKYFILLFALIIGAMYFAVKAGQKIGYNAGLEKGVYVSIGTKFNTQTMQQNRTLQITEATENKLDSILANIALCEMSLEEQDIKSATRFALQAKSHIIHIKNEIQNHESSN